MKLIVGLGNPAIEYANTRHNIGFKAIDALANNFNIELNKNKFEGIFYQNSDFILAKPLTYMNLSGMFVKKIMNYFKIKLDDLLVIYDDTAHPIGTLALKPKGSSNGHNGIQSIINELKSNQFARLKIGIGTSNLKKSSFVLGQFTKEEITKIDPLKSTIVQIGENFIKNDIVYAMNKLHQK